MVDNESANLIKPLKIGVRFKPAAIVFLYEDSFKKFHKRTMPVRGLFKNSSANRIAIDLKERHKKYIDHVPSFKIEKLLRLIQENMKGSTLNESLNIVEKEFSIDPEEDLNKLDDETLKRKKAIMDQTFELNRKKPGDADFEYDVEVDFDQAVTFEPSVWDSDKDEKEELEF